MTKVPKSTTDIAEIVNHLKGLTNELTAMHGDLYWLAMQAQDASGNQSSAAAELNVELLAELKTAVDNMRLLLWKYIETASELDPQTMREGLEAQRLRRVTQFLQLLRDRLVHSGEDEPVSFIERISAKVKERLKADRAA